jgi:signal transduction histidine kinase
MLTELDPASRASLTEVIKQSAMEISQIIERVSFVLKASADPCPFSSVKMGAVVKQVLHDLDPEINKTGATVIPPADWPEVTGVAPWLQVIWLNLLSNALQHGGPSPRITLQWEQRAGFCRFTVTDNGAGVSANRLRALFAPFDQLHELHSTGMGLSIVQRLTFLQGGNCDYEEASQGGACFHFTVPCVSGGVN